MQKMLLTREMEEKRLKDFQKIAENWDNLPEYARGKLDGTISAIAAVCSGNSVSEKKAVQGGEKDERTFCFDGKRH